MLSLASSWKQEQWGTETLESAQWLHQRRIGLYAIADVDASVDQIGEYFVFVAQLKWGLDAASFWNRQPEEIGDFVMCAETETLNMTISARKIPLLGHHLLTLVVYADKPR